MAEAVHILRDETCFSRPPLYIHSLKGRWLNAPIMSERLLYPLRGSGTAVPETTTKQAS